MSEVPTIQNFEFVQLRGLIEEWCGIELANNKLYLVETRLRDVVMENACKTYAEFAELAVKAGSELRDRIIDDMTTNETSWFRHPAFWQTFRAALLPDLLERAELEGRTQLRIWSAACSTGQEAYSIAMALDTMEREGELGQFSAGDFEILATDISQSALKIAGLARYDPISMRRGLPEAVRDRYFEREGRVHTLREEIRIRVRFDRLNLLDSFAQLGSFDAIFMRNVLIYFSPSSKQSTLEKVARALHPGGLLAVGATETPDVYNRLFDVVRHDRCTSYRAKERS